VNSHCYKFTSFSDLRYSGFLVSTRLCFSSFFPFTRKSLRDYKLRNFFQKFVRPELDLIRYSFKFKLNCQGNVYLPRVTRLLVALSWLYTWYRFSSSGTCVVSIAGSRERSDTPTISRTLNPASSGHEFQANFGESSVKMRRKRETEETNTRAKKVTRLRTRLLSQAR